MTPKIMVAIIVVVKQQSQFGIVSFNYFIKIFNN